VLFFIKKVKWVLIISNLNYELTELSLIQSNIKKWIFSIVVYNNFLFKNILKKYFWFFNISILRLSKKIFFKKLI
jgi:hypothetical protein